MKTKGIKITYYDDLIKQTIGQTSGQTIGQNNNKIADKHSEKNLKVGEKIKKDKQVIILNSSKDSLTSSHILPLLILGKYSAEDIKKKLSRYGIHICTLPNEYIYKHIGITSKWIDKIITIILSDEILIKDISLFIDKLVQIIV
jgi:hypothetical protein